MFTLTSFFATAISFNAVQAQPTPEAVLAWYQAETDRAKQVAKTFADQPIYVVWKRKDSYTHSAAELAELKTSAERHPQSRARVIWKQSETASRLGGLSSEHRLWFGEAGFRHSQNTLYNEDGSFVDVVQNVSKKSGWSLTETGLNTLPLTAQPGSSGRTAESFRIGYVQDLLPSLTGGFSELVVRTFERPTVAVTGDTFVLQCPSPSDKYLTGAVVTGVWDAASSSGLVSSVRLKARGGASDDQTFEFREWVDVAGVRFAKEAVRSMPSIHMVITIMIDSVAVVQEAEVRRVIEVPESLEGGSAYRDAVRGDLLLRSRTTYAGDRVVSESLTEQGSVRVNTPDPRTPDAGLRVMGWLLGGGVLAVVFAFVLWKRRL